MPKLSAFTPAGLLKMTSRPSRARVIYDSMKAALGEQFRTEQGDHVEASLFARAMGLARAQRLLEHAGDQALPRKVAELLAVREDEYGVVPAPGSTLAERRRELAARRRLPRGASLNNVTLALKELLGSDFISYRPTPVSELSGAVPDLGEQPQNLQPPSVLRKLIRITEPITSNLATPQFVRYAEVIPGTMSTLKPWLGEYYLSVGDVLVVNPGSPSNARRVTVEAVSHEYDDWEAGPFYPIFKATFEVAQPADIIATTMPFPAWASNKRESLIVLTDAAAANAEARRRVNEFMARVARGVSTWTIAGASSPTTSGPFRVGEGKIGITTIGKVIL